jgi:hypothetical protein
VISLDVTSQRVIVGDEEEHLVLVLQPNAICERADVVPQMERASRAIAGENSLFACHTYLRSIAIKKPRAH